MWEQDWALLGIEPTTELGVIKKAYALKLKGTRPDDDAEAYQALRGAYERVQQWLKWQQQEAAEPVAVEAPAAPVEPPAPVQAETAPPLPSAPLQAETDSPMRSEPPPPAEHVVQPRHLIDELATRWRRGGDPALLHEWASVRRELDQQPLSRQAEFSAAFAEWVLGAPELPDDFLNTLNQHFGWLDDFRTERLLGAPLTHALHEALDGRLRPVHVPEPVRELAAPLLGLDRLRQAGGAWWRLQLILLLLHPTLVRGQNLLGAQWLRQLGLDLEAQRWLGERVKRGQWLRVGTASALCWAAALLLLGDGIIATANTLGWLVATGGVMLAGLFGGALIGVGPTLTSGQRRLALPLDRWRRHRSQPWLGLAWLLFAAWLGYLDGKPDTGPAGSVLSLLPDWAYGYASRGFGIAGLVLAWPLDALRGCVLTALSPLIGFLAMAALGAWLPTASCLLIGAAWMLAAAAIHEERLGLPESAPVRWLVRPVLNNLTLADRWSYGLAMLPLAVASAWAVLHDGKVGAMRLFLVWVLSILATGWLQAKADAWGLKQLRAAPE